MHDFREAKKRPIKDIKLDKQPLTRILQRAADGKLLVSSNVGEVFYVDPKTNYSVVKKFNNAHGTITDMDLNQSQTQFCTVSLDRHLRIYSLETNALLREEFVFQKLEKCRFSKDEFDFDNHEIEAEDEEEEEPETDHMTTLTSKSNAPELFRDKLAKAGGKLNQCTDDELILRVNHNLIKLKYEKRHIAPTLEKRPAPSA